MTAYLTGLHVVETDSASIPVQSGVHQPDSAGANASFSSRFSAAVDTTLQPSAVSNLNLTTEGSRQELLRTTSSITVGSLLQQPGFGDAVPNMPIESQNSVEAGSGQKYRLRGAAEGCLWVVSTALKGFPGRLKRLGVWMTPHVFKKKGTVNPEGYFFRESPSYSFMCCCAFVMHPCLGHCHVISCHLMNSSAVVQWDFCVVICIKASNMCPCIIDCYQ